MGIIIWLVLITTIAGVFGTGFGGLISCFFKRDSDRTVSLLLSFAGGVMLSVVFLDLLADALKLKNAAGKTNVFLVSAGIILGWLVIYLLNDVIDRSAGIKPGHCKDSFKTTDKRQVSGSLQLYKSKSSRTELKTAGIVMALAIALHNLPEGMVIGAAYAADTVGQAVKYSRSGLLLAIIIGMHDIPEGMAVAVPLIGGGMKRYKAVILAALSGIPTVVGALLGYSAGMLSPFALSLSLSIAGGAMLYVVFGELLPESLTLWQSKTPAFASITGIMLGMIIIYTG